MQQDEKEAVRYFRLAAEQGNADTEFKLGHCCGEEKGVERDVKEAVRYDRLAVAQGHHAQYNLAECYEKGRGGEPRRGRSVTSLWVNWLRHKDTPRFARAGVIEPGPLELLFISFRFEVRQKKILLSKSRSNDR